MNLGRPSSPVQLTGGYLGASYSATPFQSGSVPIPNLLPQKSSSAQQRNRQMQELFEMDKASGRTIRPSPRSRPAPGLSSSPAP